MLKQILEWLAAASTDARLTPFVPRLEAARKALEARQAGSAVAEAQALLEEISKATATTPQDAKQASFNEISALIGHTPVKTGAGDSVSSGGARPKAGPTSAGPIQPLTQPEKDIEARRKKTERFLREYDTKVQAFGDNETESAGKAEAAKRAFDLLKVRLEARKKEYDLLRIRTPNAQKDIAAGDYGTAYKAYGAALGEYEAAGGELLKLAETARLEAEESKDAKGPADSLFDDFLTFRKNASKLADAEKWLAKQDSRDTLVLKKLADTDTDIKKFLGKKVAKGCATLEALRKRLEDTMQQAQAARATSEADAGAAAGTAAKIDKIVVQVERRIMFTKDLLEGKAAKEARETLDKKYFDGDNVKAGIVAADMKEAGSGNTSALRNTFDDLRYARSSLTGAQIKQLCGEIFDKVLKDKAMLTIVSNDPELCGDLIMMAEKEGKLDDDVLKSLGGKTSAVAQRVLLEKTRDGAGGGKTSDWMWDAVALEDWNAKDKGISAQVYNSLWNSGDYDRICKLIAKGANPGQAHSLGQDSGRGSGKKEGIWSGFIQPIEHLLGNYVRKVHELGENPAAFTGDELKKVEGAKKVLAALKGKSSILTDYKEIRDSPAIVAFNEKPGTIWGFEDVRLPYVQAAREGTKGNQPLRMWELWKAVEKALSQNGYDELLQNPDEAIPKFVEEGKKAVAAEIKDSHAYPNLDLGAFLKEFELQATAYLEHLAQQIPKGQFDTAELSGMDPGKLMGGLGCKAGLWWAKESGKPVYYCIDGINIDEAVDYKAWKNAKIKANLEEGGSKHFEVITFAEIREILKNWEELSKTVVFIEQGKILGEGRVLAWRKKMLEMDTAAGKRPAPPPEKFKGKLEALGGDVWTKIQGEPYDAMKVTVKVDTLIRIAKMDRKRVLPRYLKEKGELLEYYQLIPKELAAAGQQVVDAKTPQALSAAKAGFESLVRKASPALQESLSRWSASVG